VKLLSAPYRA